MTIITYEPYFDEIRANKGKNVYYFVNGIRFCIILVNYLCYCCIVLIIELDQRKKFLCFANILEKKNSEGRFA